ncbi:hypothetical protein [Agromyces salentinus]|uniref:hypothetical protein n=1 Tax=Agromyces salentinus TaxID=269421 RepID=UPI0012F8D7C3|nr:hypothetical protein [Agromyces salentinus]
MATTAAWLSAIIGVGLLTWSVVVVSRANAGDELPYWTNAARTPRRSMGLRVAGVALVILGTGLLSPTLSYWAVAIVVGAFLPGIALMIWHNQAVSRMRRRDAGRMPASPLAGGTARGPAASRAGERRESEGNFGVMLEPARRSDGD